MKKALLIVALVAMCATGAQAAVVTFSGDGSAGAGDIFDNPMEDRIAWTTTGNGGPMAELQLNENYRNRRTAMRVDVSSLGTVPEVLSVTLRLTLSRDYAGGNVAVNRILPADSTWEEGGYGWGGFWSSSTSWLLQTSSSYVMLMRYQAWSGSYGTMLANQYVSGVAGDTVDFVFAGTNAELTAMINAWATAPVFDVGAGAWANRTLPHVDVANEGFMIRGFDDVFFASAENGTYPGPQLLVDVVPEPATMSLLAIGGIVALIRRKK